MGDEVGQAEKGERFQGRSEREESEREKVRLLERVSERAGRGDSLREKTPVFIVFVKYYCSDFILTIVFLFCFLLVSSLVGV